MTPNRRSSSETVKCVLLWGFGVFVPILLMLLVLVFVVMR
jgi:hypothetical protein